MVDEPKQPSGTNSALLKQARIQLQNKMVADAVESLTLLLRNEPRNAEAWELIGVAHTMLHKTEEARSAFEQATKIEPARASAHYNYAILLSQLNELDDAVDEINTALYLNASQPGAANLHANLSERIRFRGHTSVEGFEAKGSGGDPLSAPPPRWARISCTACGENNFITARTCWRCGNMLPEMDEVVPVE